MELLTAPPDANIMKMGEIGSVTGSAHKYIRYTVAVEKPRLPQGEAPVAPEHDEQPVDEALLSMIHDVRHDFDQDKTKPTNSPAAVDYRSLYTASQQEDED